MIPRIGRYWDGQGGIYAGIARGQAFDYHLILSIEDGKRDVIWTAANEWTNGIEFDGHRDFRLPTRSEAALLYANVRDHISEHWHWTNEEYPPDKECMWAEAFSYGRQADCRKTDACRARAVRIFQCAL